MNKISLKDFLDKKVDEYNQPFFIQDDPIGIPHRFTKKQDIEIAGFFAAVLAWGNRKSIINSCDRLLTWMHNAPYDFIMHFEEKDLIPFMNFVHRTFNATDLFHFFNALKYHYRVLGNKSFETAFSQWMQPADQNVENALNGFHHYFFSTKIDDDYPRRTIKHIAAPFKKSACKRLNMYLRWMVRHDNKGVDFGVWKKISPSQLICPVDLHVARVAKRFNLLHRKQTDWLAAVELTDYLRTLDKDDPVKYDFALFGLGVIDKF
ncbi:MAG: TIGR02757 family protein [Chitinophagaceae bacterium]